MNLKQAFIEVKYLNLKMESLWTVVKKYNSVLAGKTRPFDVRKLLEEINFLTKKKIELKSAIAASYIHVRPLVIECKEIKSQLRHLYALNYIHGPHKTTFGTLICEMDANLREDEIELMKRNLELRLKECELQITELLHTTQLE